MLLKRMDVKLTWKTHKKMKSLNKIRIFFQLCGYWEQFLFRITSSSGFDSSYQLRHSYNCYEILDPEE